MDKTTLIIAGIDIGIGIIELMCGEILLGMGMIILGFGIVQVGLSLKSHDPSQRANGFLTVAGGIIITFAKEILNMITG